MADISVIIPTYNRADLLRETVQSVLAQAVPPSEIIVVDDGSTDATPPILSTFGAPVRSIRIENSGELVARNTGLRAAKYPLVAFCDSDDLWQPEFLARMSAAFDAEPALVACYSDFRVLKDGDLSVRSKFADAPDGFWAGLRSIGPDMFVFDQAYVARVLTFQPFFPSCMMVSRAAFIAIGGWDEAVSRIVGCDFATVLRVALRPPVGVVHAPLVGIRKHADNFSANTERMNLGDAQVLDHVVGHYPDFAAYRPLMRESAARRRREALDSAFSRRDFMAVRTIYGQLPHGGDWPKQRVKHALACLPRPLALLAAGIVSR